MVLQSRHQYRSAEVLKTEMEVKKGLAQQRCLSILGEFGERSSLLSQAYSAAFTGVCTLAIGKQCCGLNILAYSYTSKIRCHDLVH